MNALGLPDNWFWWVRLVACRFYCLEVSPNDSSLERFRMLKKEKKRKDWNRTHSTKAVDHISLELRSSLLFTLGFILAFDVTVAYHYTLTL